MTDIVERVAAVEARVENAFALDARLKSIESDIRKVQNSNQTAKQGSSLREWVQTLGPYVSGLIVLLVGFWIKDSVTLALQREQLDLEYVKQMRDLIKDFDEANNQAAADANAFALAMYGKYAIIPLVEHLEGGDVAPLAAEKGLRLIGSNDPKTACPKFVGVITDKGRRFTWQTHKTLIRVIGQSYCIEARSVLEQYNVALNDLHGDSKKAAAFGRRYSSAESFDIETAASLHKELDEALTILEPEVTP